MTENPKATSASKTVAVVFVCIFGLAFLAVGSGGTVQDSSLPTNSLEAASPQSPQVRTDIAYAQVSTKQYCAERYPSDLSMRAACGRNAASGRADFLNIWNRFIQNEAMKLALQQCFARYTQSDITNFAMLGACARNQEDGYNELN